MKVIFRDQLAQSQQIYICYCVCASYKTAYFQAQRILLLLHVFLCLGVRALLRGSRLSLSIFMFTFLAQWATVTCVRSARAIFCVRTTRSVRPTFCSL